MTWRHRGIAIAVAIVAVIGLLALHAGLDETALDRLHARPDRSFAGSIDLPRGGRYVFGCQCTGRLTIDGRTIRLDDPTGAYGVPVDHDAGVVSFVAWVPPGARLLWHPPGRRGPLEYLPPSSLSADPPARARFGAGAGARLLDGAIALGIVAVAAALALFLAAPRLRRLWRDDRIAVLAFAAVLALALAVRLVDLGGAGQTWDEDVNWSAGRNYVSNVVSLDGDQRSWIWNFEHPPVMKYLAGVGAVLTDGYGLARAISALELALACGLLVPIGRRLWSLRAGVAAGAIAALTPHLIAHGKVVGHEAPTVLWWTLALYLCLRAYDGVDVADRRAATRLLARRFAVIGVVLGLAVFTRFVNLLLAPFLGITLLVLAPAALRARVIALGLAILPVVALAVGVAIWPRLWSHPIAHLDEAWAKLSREHTPEPFLGRITRDPPRWYFLAYLGATAPIGVLVAVIVGVARAVRGREWRALAVVLTLLIVPLGVAFSPVRQDGVRYVMPSLIALALLAGAGLDAAGRSRRVFAGIAAVAALYLAIVCVRIHPYYLDYYGEQVGGPANVARHRWFETGWWGEGVAEATDWLAAHAGPDDRIYRDCIEAVHLAWFHPAAWHHLARRPSDAEWIVVQPAARACPIPTGFAPAHEVRAMGAPLVRIWRRE